MIVVVVMGLAVAGCGGSRGPSGTNVVVTASGPTETVAAGANVVFVMTVRNVGNNVATAMQLVNQLGAGLSQPVFSCEASAGATCPSALGAVMSVPVLPVGGQLVFTIEAAVTGTTSGTTSNTMTATLAEDVDRLDNAAIVQVDVLAAASNLVVTGLGPAGTVTGGGTAEFLMTVRNDGPDPATGVRITQTVGGNLTLTDIACAASGGGICPAPGVVMTLDSLPAGATLAFTVTATVGPGISGTIVNTLSASADNESERDDNSATVSGTAFTARAGVFATGVGPSGPVAGGSTAAFTMTVTNAGPDPATDLRLVDTVGSNLTLTQVTCAAGGGAVCPATLGPVMTVASMPAGGALSFEVLAFVAAGTNGSITNTLVATPSNDPDRTDNTAVAVGTASTSRAKLVASGVGPAEPAAGGAIATFVMSVANDGPDVAQDVRLVNVVSGNLTLMNITCSALAGASCPTTGPVMSLPSLPVGSSLSFTVEARVATGANGAITNQLSASAANAALTGADSAVAVGQAFSAANDLTLAGTAPSAVPAGSNARFAMTLANQGGDTASDIRVVNTIGGNLTLVGIACRAAGGAACPAGVGVVTLVPSLPAGGSLMFDVDAVVATGSNGLILNSMTASTSSGVPTQVSAVAVGSAYAHNLTVAATAPAGPLPGGSVATFSLVVSNVGPSAALDVEIANLASEELTVNEAGIGCSAGQGAVCPGVVGATMVAPLVPAGGFLSFVVPVTVNAGANGSASNTMSVSAAGDARLNDNSATAIVAVASSDLGVSMSVPAQVAAGGTATFTALVGNPGPGAASDVEIGLALQGGTLANITCSPSAFCPAILGPAMSLASLPAGRTLSFEFSVPVMSSPSSFVGTVSVTAVGDPSTDNNTAEATVRGIDARNGNYRVYAADGRQYTMDIDFDDGIYTMTGPSGAQQESFAVNASGDYVVDGARRLRSAEDLIVGAHAFAAGVQPYVAARRFTATVAQAGGVYDMFTRNIGPDGAAAVTRPATARISGNALLICQDDAVVAQVTACDPTKLKTYTLTVAGDEFTGVDVAGGTEYRFRVAATGASQVLLSAGPSTAGIAGDTRLQFRVAMPDTPAIVGGTLRGPTIDRAGASDWVSMLLSSSQYAVLGDRLNDLAGMQRVGQAGPFSMLFGVRGDANKIWVMQSPPLGAMIGDALDGASGELQLAIP